MNKQTLTSRVLNYMIDKGSISTWEAIKEFGATRLSDIIYRLRNKGFWIENEWIHTTNRYGDRIKYVKYNLIKEKTFDFSTKASELEQLY